MSGLLHPGPHPDADSLSAFVEGVLPEHERLQCLAHFAECARCREAVFLAQEPAPVPVAPVPAPGWRRWFAPMPAWGAAVACLVVAGVAVYVRQAPVPTATTIRPAPAAKVRADARVPASAEPKREVAPRARRAGEPIASAKEPVVVGIDVDPPFQEPPLSPLPTPMPAPSPLPVIAGAEPSPPSFGIGSGRGGGGARPPSAAVSEIAGSVTDSSGAVVPRASVGVRQIAGNVTRSTQADADGRFRVASLPPGQYEVHITSPGFRDERRQVEVEAQRPTVVSSVLSVGAVTESVEVTAMNATIAVTRDAPRPLPSKLPGATTVVSGKITVAMDTTGALFVSTNAGRSWKTVKAVWPGKAVELTTLTSPVAAFQLTTESGSVWLSRDGARWFSAPR